MRGLLRWELVPVPTVRGKTDTPQLPGRRARRFTVTMPPRDLLYGLRPENSPPRPGVTRAPEIGEAISAFPVRGA